MILVIVHQILQFSSYLMIIIIIKHVQAPVYVFMIRKKLSFQMSKTTKKNEHSCVLCEIQNELPVL